MTRRGGWEARIALGVEAVPTVRTGNGAEEGIRPLGELFRGHMPGEGPGGDGRAQGRQSMGSWAEIKETHASTGIFLGDRVFKLRKAVKLGPLDFTTREARQGVCRDEAELNRRLASDVYKGVADVLGSIA